MYSFKLATDLEARFVKIVDHDRYQIVDHIQDAQGVWFLCPACYATNGNSNVGTHMILCWFKDRGVPIAMTPGPGRWQASGNNLDRLSLEPSVSLHGGCAWHGYVRNGFTETVQ